MRIVLYRTVNASTAGELDTAINELLGQGYQLYGSPYLSDGSTEGVAGTAAFYQAMTLDDQTRDINAASALKKDIAQGGEIQALKMSKPN